MCNPDRYSDYYFCCRYSLYWLCPSKKVNKQEKKERALQLRVRIVQS